MFYFKIFNDFSRDVLAGGGNQNIVTKCLVVFILDNNDGGMDFNFDTKGGGL